MIVFAIHLLLLAALLTWLRPTHHVAHYYGAWLIRIGAGITLGYCYLHVWQTGDTVLFHEEALKRAASPSFWQELWEAKYPIFKSEARTELFVKCVSVIHRMSGGNYWVACLYFSTLGFAGAWFAWKQVYRYLPPLHLPAMIGFFLFPSVILWSSGVLKDSLTNTCLMGLTGLLIRYWFEKDTRWWEVPAMFICLLLLFYLKFYLVAVSFLTLGTAVLVRHGWPWMKTSRLSRLIVVVLTVGVVVLATHVNWNLRPQHLPQAVYDNYLLLKSENGPTFSHLAPTWPSLFSHLPFSLFSGLYRPSLTDVWQPLAIPFALENLLLLIFSVWSLMHAKTWVGKPLVWLALFFVLTLAAFLPLVSPNWGSLLRYRSAFIPIWIWLTSIIPWNYWISRKG